MKSFTEARQLAASMGSWTYLHLQKSCTDNLLVLEGSIRYNRVGGMFLVMLISITNYCTSHCCSNTDRVWPYTSL